MVPSPNCGLEEAILHTVDYADLFDYPLTAQQIHRYLTGCLAPVELVEQRLAEDSTTRSRLEPVPIWVLDGRKHLSSLGLSGSPLPRPFGPQSAGTGRSLHLRP